jgi:flavin-dependent dehydrogenase
VVLGLSLAGNPLIMPGENKYDVAIAGGGLAGLAASIEIARAGYKVVLFEKEKYPFHKVCGEYISLESWNYLGTLGLPLGELNLPIIKNFMLSAPSGKTFETRLPLGGFGISRWLLDDALAKLARQAGVDLQEETKVDDVYFADEEFLLTMNGAHGKAIVKSKICFASFGKRSNLDVKWKRSFLLKQDKRLDNFLGVKYHVHANWPEDKIGLHNFRNGYCGISKIEEDKYCLCYMVRAEELQKAGNDMAALQNNLLSKNPVLAKLLKDNGMLPGFPVTISQINFADKTRVENHMLMLGDAAGMITPLCGNGMSIALHTGKIGAGLAVEYLGGRISREEMESSYSREWNRNFAKRLKTGRALQKFFGSERKSNGFVNLLRAFPFLAKPVIKLTHGKPF